MMSNPRNPEGNPDRGFGWADGVSLEKYLEMRIQAQREYVDTKLAALDQAIKVAAVEMTRRLEAMNGLRADLDKQQDTFALKKDVEALTDTVNQMRRDSAQLAGMATQKSVNDAKLIAATGVVIGILSIVVGVIIRLI